MLIKRLMLDVVLFKLLFFKIKIAMVRYRFDSISSEISLVAKYLKKKHVSEEYILRQEQKLEVVFKPTCSRDQ